MESGHVSGTDIGSDLKTHRVANPSENNHVSPDNNSRLSSSNSSSSSLSGEVIQLSSTRTNTSDAGVSTPLKDKHTEEETPISSMLNSGRSCTDGSATLIPPTQAMKRSAGGSPLATSDRIPSYVFRTSTTAQTEWSVASNESLFSIQMGTMSFSKDQLSWMSKSGELGYICDSPMSGPFVVEVPSNQTPTRKSTELTKKSGNLNEGRFGVTEAAAAETMREVLREKESQHTDNIAKESPRSLSLSRHSDASVKSFAFPILTGDADKSGSTMNKKQLSQPSTPKTTPVQPPLETPKTQTPQETPKPPTLRKTLSLRHRKHPEMYVQEDGSLTSLVSHPVLERDSGVVQMACIYIWF